MAELEGQELADSVARALNAADIPCVLWGHYLMSAHGIPTCTASIDFVVPDAKLAAAQEVISTSTHFTQPLVACPDTTTCLKTAPGLSQPYPEFHLHIEGMTDPLVTTAVMLFVQSKTLWFLPRFRDHLAKPREQQLPRYLALASDKTALPPVAPGMGYGHFKSDETVVLVPKVHIFLEALMRIYARDYWKDIGIHSRSYFNYIGIYVEKRGFLNLDLLPEPFKDLYMDFTQGSMLGRDVELRMMRTLGTPIRASQYR
ncbi:thioredoxin reductase [Chaetomidium leptoderma]|uniref:Thioredoxin reductase n=1 Tax=Chaetomidium leptoderma TaxID=669021 RepID=A0AAN6ZYG5_9PEZI|nr:thioredoxin reductase [Chaetomidium leptoderma]